MTASTKKKTAKKKSKKKVSRRKGLLPVEKKEISIHQSNDPATAMIQVLERAVLNPKVDVDKMERIMQMQLKVIERNAEIEFNQAMANCQTGMRSVSADMDNDQTGSRYASYKALDKALRPIYSSQYFALSFNTEPRTKEDIVTVLCYVTHKAGHTRTYTVDMPADGKGPKGGAVMSTTHATGAAVSYGMRYLLKMIFNVAVGQEDTDGNLESAEPVNYISDIQVNELDSKIREHKVNMEGFLTWMNKELKIKSIETIPENFYDYVDKKIDTVIKNNA